MSTPTVATNKLRLLVKQGKKSSVTIGMDKLKNKTNKPEEILDGGDLLPFSYGDFWYKSFFLGLAIELLAAVAGGKTGSRVGSGIGDRFESKEGLMAIIIDN
jgi:LDH2 family malate/lactate/ureidoglycolate dehydrogenase